jgi:hypothetical protein
LEFCNARRGLFNLGGVDVADGRDFGVAFSHEPLQHVDQAAAPVAEPDEGDAHFRQGFGL